MANETPLINGINEVHLIDAEGKVWKLADCFADEGCSVSKDSETVTSAEGIGNSQETITERVNSTLKLVFRWGSVENSWMQYWHDQQIKGKIMRSCKLVEAYPGKAPKATHETKSKGNKQINLVFIKKPAENTHLGKEAKDRTWELQLKHLQWPSKKPA